MKPFSTVKWNCPRVTLLQWSAITLPPSEVVERNASLRGTRLNQRDVSGFDFHAPFRVWTMRNWNAMEVSNQLIAPWWVTRSSKDGWHLDDNKTRMPPPSAISSAEPLRLMLLQLILLHQPPTASDAELQINRKDADIRGKWSLALSGGDP